jgi:hypothetical protein
MNTKEQELAEQIALYGPPQLTVDFRETMPGEDEPEPYEPGFSWVEPS